MPLDPPVDPVEWQRVSRAFDVLIDLDPEQRAAALDRVCEGDALLRARVQAMLDADARAGRFLERPDASERQDAVIGTMFGSYRVVREIGRGGMGRVFVAARADGAFEQTVAIKIMRHGIDADEGRARFFRERQILARLEHPNIARLLDGGITDTGVPFFAMEYVDGEPLTACAERCGLSVDQRVALFLAVCDGVRAAHRHLVVHRDLKSSNVLVTADGTVKLLDFGIAKLLEEDPANEGVTRFGSGPLTPEFAAPEQIRGGAITTATDIYAMGALLYELLTGRSPHRFDSRTPAEFERVVCDVVPSAPSLIAAAPFRTALRGDLDTIVMRALEKDPARRYPSVEALADDVQRYRAGRPILARPATVRYRASRFVKRHAVGVSAAALIVIAVLAGIAATIWQARIATAEAARSRETARFLTGLFELSSPEQSLGRTITARELLDRAAVRVDRELAEQPDLQAEMQTILGTIHHQLGMFTEATTELQRALDLRRTLYRGDDERVASTLVALANAHSENLDGRSAEGHAREALAMHQRLHGEVDGRTAAAWEALGAAVGAQDREEEQLAAHQRVVTIRRQLEDPEALARALNNVGVAMSNTGDYAGAEAVHREALEIRRRVLPAEHPDLANSLENLATTRSRLGRYADAIELQREAIAIRRKVYGEMHPFVAISLNNLGVRMDQLGNREEAERLHQEALRIRRASLGDDHPQTLQSINGLAIAAFRRGDLQAALNGFREATDRWSRTLGPLHGDTLTAAGNVGVVLTELGELREAERVLRDMLSRRRAAQSGDHPDIAVAMRYLGVALHRAGRLDEARGVLEDSVRRHRAAFPGGHLRLAEALVALGAVLRDRGAHARAEPLLREALAIRQKAIKVPDERLAEAQRELGVCLAARGRRDEAERLLLSSYDAVAAKPGAERHARRSASALATFYERVGDTVQAARYNR